MSHTTAAAALTVGQAPYNVLFILTDQERYFRPWLAADTTAAVQDQTLVS